MRIAKNISAFELPREKTKSYFSRGDLSFSDDSHLCFVCGANGDALPNGEKSLRSLYISHAKEKFPGKIICVRAETAATELLRQIDERGQNISLFEKTIAETVDSVLIFPESPGSFAELGFFSGQDAIARKTLVALKVRYQEGSFITLGPIHLISKSSRFAPVPIVLGEDPLAQMKLISERLLGESINKRPYRHRLELKPWKEYSGRQQLALLDDLIDLVGALTEPDLLHLIKEIFGAYDVSSVRLQLSLLVAMDRIARSDHADIFAKPRDYRFVEGLARERIAVSAKWREFFSEHMPDALVEMEAHQ